MTRMYRLGGWIGALLMLQTAQAETRIDSVQADREGLLLTIVGKEFTAGLASGQSPYVEFNGQALTLQPGYSDTLLQATLPAEYASTTLDGEYQVFVSRTGGRSRSSDPHAAPADEIANYSLSLITPMPGPQGPQGDAGPVGATGAQGSKGDKGDPGDQGAAGTPGEAGPQGAVGPAGPTGAMGPAGATGPQGATGEKGDKGDTGATGASGTTGQDMASQSFGYVALPNGTPMKVFEQNITTTTPNDIIAVSYNMVVRNNNAAGTAACGVLAYLTMDGAASMQTIFQVSPGVGSGSQSLAYSVSAASHKVAIYAISTCANMATDVTSWVGGTYGSTMTWMVLKR